MTLSDFMDKFAAFKNRLLQNLLTGVKTALLRPVVLDLVDTSWLQIAALLVLSLLPSAISQLLSVGLAGEFTAYGLPGILFPFPVIFIVVALAAKLLGVDEKTGAIILVTVSASIFIDAVTCALPYVLAQVGTSERTIEAYANNIAGYWLGVVFAVLLLRLEPLADGKRWGVAIVAGLAIAFAINDVWRTRTVWDEPYDQEQTSQKLEEYYAAVTEEVLYLQPKLLADHLNKLRPGKGDIPNLYFLGVAGYAEQGVFMREIRSVEKVMLDRFSNIDRSLLLVNNKDTLRTEPIATTTSIKEVIKRTGEVMDQDNDILFIYLTSHGSKEHKLSLQFSPLQLKDLEPVELRKMLDESGVQWRVVVVSACYSGGFIEPLANDKTLVITAAAADRTSFGCSDENDFTYFGRAYFEEALGKTSSFIEAFDLAKESVTKRELAESQKPSNPQIFIGKDIREKLEAFQAGATIHPLTVQ